MLYIILITLKKSFEGSHLFSEDPCYGELCSNLGRAGHTEMITS